MGFSFDSFEGVGSVFPLGGNHEPIVLGDLGVRHPRSQRSGATVHTAYADVTHLAATPRIFWLGARDSVYIIPRAAFVNTDAPELLASALRKRISEQSGGPEQLRRFEEIERISEDAKPPYVTRALIGICLAVFLLQQWLGLRLELAGQLIPELVSDGDLWRVITANLLHAPGGMGVIHIGFNMMALLALGTMAERPLGAARTICLMVFSGMGAMLAATWFSDLPVVGASGIVLGLAGAVIWLDIKRSEELPAWWRFPRRSLVWNVVVISVLGAVVPFIAFAAHAGGLVAGGFAAAVMTGSVGAPAPLRTQIASGLALLVAFLAVGTAAIEVAKPGDPAARYAQRVSGLPEISPGVLNDFAWVMATATDPVPNETMLLAALALAERAVSETGRSEPTILDTLAEVQFQLGNADAAISIIDEAIALDPGSAYFFEQRRRFTGERERDDRPDYVPPMFRGEDESEREPVEPPAAEGELTV